MICLFLLAWLAGQSPSPSPDAMQHLQAGLEARKQHQVETEIVEFRKATELDPALADAYVNLGAAYMEKGDYGAAVTPLKRALEISSDLVVAHQFLGYALLEQAMPPKLFRILSVWAHWMPWELHRSKPVS